jgi:hypothetical protein
MLRFTTNTNKQGEKREGEARDGQSCASTMGFACAWFPPPRLTDTFYPPPLLCYSVGCSPSKKFSTRICRFYSTRGVCECSGLLFFDFSHHANYTTGKKEHQSFFNRLGGRKKRGASRRYVAVFLSLPPAPLKIREKQKNLGSPNRSRGSGERSCASHPLFFTRVLQPGGLNQWPIVCYLPP